MNLAELAAHLEGQLVGDQLPITQLSALSEQKNSLSFILDEKQLKEPFSTAAAFIVFKK